MAGMVLNGWQRIQRVDGNSTICGGTQITYTPSSKTTLNYSTFIGNVYPDSIKRTRFFNNLYGIIQVTERLGLIAGLDYGIEQKNIASSNWNKWLGAAIILRYKTSGKTAIAARAEYYMDENNVIVAAGAPNGFYTSGFSANFDHNIMNNVLWRVEGKILHSENAIFTDKKGAAVNTNFVATTSLSITIR